jgi:predicted ATP-binding protein involved in virulence
MTTPKGVNKINLKETYGLHDHPGKEFHQYIVNLRAQRAFANEKNDVKTIKKIENWFDMFENSLKEIFKDPSLRMAFDSENINFNIMQKGKDPFNFNTMADGYSALIDVVSDIILRMEKHKNKSYDVQGLVLIDELETHLHIDLQKKVFPFLTRFFPRIQFIVTTHSPFILSSIDNAIIYDLENKLLVDDLSGYSYDGIIEAYFRNDLYSDSAKKDLETYERLVNQEKRTEEEEERMMDLRIELENIPDSLAPELKVRFQQIELKRIRQHS